MWWLLLSEGESAEEQMASLEATRSRANAVSLDAGSLDGVSLEAVSLEVLSCVGVSCAVAVPDDAVAGDAFLLEPSASLRLDIAECPDPAPLGLALNELQVVAPVETGGSPPTINAVEVRTELGYQHVDTGVPLVPPPVIPLLGECADVPSVKIVERYDSLWIELEATSVGVPLVDVVPLGEASPSRFETLGVGMPTQPSIQGVDIPESNVGTAFAVAEARGADRWQITVRFRAPNSGALRVAVRDSTNGLASEPVVIEEDLAAPSPVGCTCRCSTEAATAHHPAFGLLAGAVAFAALRRRRHRRRQPAR